ncbi:hypothetical protein HK104_002278, partial [Borealophlyctis nickersoniae]
MKGWLLHARVQKGPCTMMVSTPHPISNIRLVRYEGVAESDAEKEYRSHRERIQRWHHEFWAANNTHFQQSKLQYEQN